MTACSSSSWLDMTSGCVRTLWATLMPSIILLLALAAVVPKPRPLRRLFRPVTSAFDPFLSVPQAEAYDSPNDLNADDVPPTLSKSRPPLARTLALVLIALVECLAWTFAGSLSAVQHAPSYDVARAYTAAAAWLYATVRPVVRPVLTSPYDLFVLFVALIAGALLELVGAFYARTVYGIFMPSRGTVVAQVLDVIALVVLLGIVVQIPMDVPSDRVDASKVGSSVSPEDYTTLTEWITFKWVWPLVRKGTHETLSEDDVWDLGPTLRSRPVFVQFARTMRSTLLRRIIAANSFDLMMDFLGAYVSVAFNYASPYFLRRILEAIDDPTQAPETRARAYVFAILAFLSQVIKTQADLQHLWFGRRAATRIRSELMASIYDKALKRKDFSGVVTNKPEAKGPAEDAKKDKKKEDATKGDEPAAGADVGKIVNLMAGDANRIAMTCSAMYFVYSAPFEIAIGAAFLYRLLGLSAFAGFFVLIAAWPLNSWISRRGIRIQRGVMSARDGRMAVLNEVVGAVKFIKFFGWEDRWIGRALEAREKEMGWLTKARLNSVMFHALWAMAPIGVSVVSFAVYVLNGHELDVATAFTAIALFQMIRVPLNVLPSWIVQILQTMVAMNRISTFLGEDEVDGQVSSLKAPPPGAYSDAGESGYDVLGIERGLFRWNEVTKEEKKDDAKGKGKGKDDKSSSNGSNGGATNGHSEDGADTDRASLSSGADADHRFELRDISVVFPEGKMTLVTGPTASGKTALLMALLGELTTIEGRILMRKDSSRVDPLTNLRHTISYAAQTPWLRHQSIKDNILFGYPLDETRYQKVLEACALGPDLAILEDGDATEIGARGVSLSGGQKARVALARAVYAPSKYVLLDDPLSAVDSHTARLLFDSLLCGELLRDRTVILVTHHVELVLPGAHYLVRMLDGRIDTQGIVSDLRAAGVLDDIARAEDADTAKDEQAVADATAKEDEQTAVEGEAEDPEAKEKKKPRKLVKDEERQAGSVKWKIYKTYLRASSYWTWAILALLVLLVQLLVITEKVWIKLWGEAYSKASATLLAPRFVSISFDLLDGPSSSSLLQHSVHSHGHGLASGNSYNSTAFAVQSDDFAPVSLPDAHRHPLFYVGVYAAIGFATALASVLSTATQYTGALKASRTLFRRLLESVVRATMRWHDTTPTGRMLNRFSKDIETVDSSLASSLQAVNTSMASFIASVATVAVVFPAFLLPAFALGFVYYHLAIGYLNTGRDLRRMESNSRSPIFSGFGELLEGIVTVRAFAVERQFLDSLHTKIDMTTKMWYNFWMMNRWLLLNFDILGAAAVLVTTLFALSGFVTAGTAGICITSAMAFTMSIYWTCRFWTGLELDLNSVERVVEYLDLPQEPPTLIEDHRPPPEWPSSVSNNLVVVDNLVVKYAPELPAVLHGISFALRGGERVGLLGRTGSGKSTLAMSILRFADPTSGRIIVDGIDITTIGLHDLRTRITFIPQDATLFTGTLRENLDPFNEHDDIECLDALYRVNMLTEGAYQSQRSSRQSSRTPTRPPSPSASSSLTEVVPEGSVTSATDVDSKSQLSLDTQVSAGGSNFSQGQRQLIAMARALLRHSSIIVLDEATSSIDFATDAKIQKAIRQEFGGALLLTVAHRLKTVIDYDRLIVLDKGTVAEFDTPWNLIQKEDGIFRSMCMKSGTFAELEEIARNKAGVSVSSS